MNKQVFETILNDGIASSIVFDSPTQILNCANDRQIKKLVSNNRKYIVSSNSLEVTISSAEAYDDFKLKLVPPVAAQYEGKILDEVELIEFHDRYMIIHYLARGEIDTLPDETTTEFAEEVWPDSSENENTQCIENLREALAHQEQEIAVLKDKCKIAKELYELKDKELLEYLTKIQTRKTELLERLRTSTRDTEDDLDSIKAMYTNEFVMSEKLQNIEFKYLEIKQQLDGLCEQLKSISIEAENKGNQRTTELNKEIV